MKKVLKISGIVLLVIIALLIIIPIAFKGPIEKVVKQKINEASAMTIDYNDFSLSIFSSFPDLRAGLEGLMVADSLGTDTIATAGELAIDVNLWGAIANQQLAINKVALYNANVAYVDTVDTLAAYVKNINLELRGNLDAELTNINMGLDIENIQLWMAEQKMLDGASVDFDANVEADLVNNKFTFKDNTLNLAGIPLAFDGWAQLVDTTVVLDVRLAALETSFKTLLALVPDYILKDVQGLKADGSLELFATAKGTYVNTDSLPTIDAVLKVNNGKIQYPDLPKSLNNINIDVKVENPGASLDETTVNVNTFHVELGNNPFDIDLSLATPISNPTFAANMVGVIDLNSLKDAIPLDSMTIGGLVNANVHIATDLATVEAEKFEDVKADGTIALKDFSFVSNDLPMGAKVPEAKLKFAPRAVELNPLKVNVGQSDFSLNGTVENYIPYVLADGTIRGKFALNSSLVDANELMALSSGTEEVADTTAVSEEESSVVAVPQNIDFSFTAAITKLLYDKLEIANVNGAILAKGGIATLNNVGLNMCDGSVRLNGVYNSVDTLKPFIDMDFDLSQVDINKLTNSFAVVDSMLPIAKSAHGKINVALSLKSDLDQQMSPVTATMNGKGSFSSSDIALRGSDFQTKLSNLLGNDKYSDLSLKDAATKFVIENGSLIIDPFKIKMLGKQATFSGKQGLDQTMDYLLSIPFSREEVVKLAKIQNVLSTEGADLPVGIAIRGTLTKPSLSLDLKEATASITNEVKDKVKDAVAEKAEEVKEKVAEKVTEKLTEKLGSDEKVQQATEGAKNLLNGLFKKK